ncbi:hypothetical protein [Chengkuizengella sediminis]|uniref:hypothetical protein n=1 Tax=Chengkuizengella sediminis TaxID=1885917 RepID=UPI00138A605A|nr:hypothetical protein [Chengkuizengella sediminis]NDI36117.1 hypothetical protein [Chengkuizengella sediminis]
MFRKTQKSNQEQFEDLEQQLNSLPIFETSPSFIDDVMLHTKEMGSKKKVNIHKQFKQRNEAIHIIIASAATYFFISEGIFSTFIQMNPEQFSMEVHDTVNGAITYGSEFFNMISTKISQIVNQ